MEFLILTVHLSDLFKGKVASFGAAEARGHGNESGHRRKTKGHDVS